MTRRVLSLVALMACYAPLADAQNNFSRWEVFGGYSYLRADLSDDDFLITGEGENFNGFHVKVAGNVNRHFGLAGDISGHYKSFDVQRFGGIPEVRLRSARASLHSFLGGPQVKSRGNATTLQKVPRC